MKKFKKVSSSKLDKLVKDAPEKSLLASLLGGSNTKSCDPSWHFANTVYVRSTGPSS